MAVLGAYFEFNYYRRIGVPQSLNNIESDNFNDYMFEFINVMFPEYEIHRVVNFSDKKCSFQEEKCIDFINADYKYGHVASIGIYLYTNGEPIYMTIRNVPQDLSKMTEVIGWNTTLRACGPLSDGVECRSYFENWRTRCYVTAVNHGFSAGVPFRYYCPTKTYFERSGNQIVNYLFDGFMALDIPYEFSYEYLESQNE